MRKVAKGAFNLEKKVRYKKERGVLDKRRQRYGIDRLALFTAAWFVLSQRRHLKTFRENQSRTTWTAQCIHPNTSPSKSSSTCQDCESRFHRQNVLIQDTFNRWLSLYRAFPAFCQCGSIVVLSLLAGLAFGYRGNLSSSFLVVFGTSGNSRSTPDAKAAICQCSGEPRPRKHICGH